MLLHHHVLLKLLFVSNKFSGFAYPLDPEHIIQYQDAFIVYEIIWKDGGGELYAQWVNRCHWLDDWWDR